MGKVAKKVVKKAPILEELDDGIEDLEDFDFDEEDEDLEEEEEEEEEEAPPPRKAAKAKPVAKPVKKKVVAELDEDEDEDEDEDDEDEEDSLGTLGALLTDELIEEATTPDQIEGGFYRGVTNGVAPKTGDRWNGTTFKFVLLKDPEGEVTDSNVVPFPAVYDWLVFPTPPEKYEDAKESAVDWYKRELAALPGKLAVIEPRIKARPYKDASNRWMFDGEPISGSEVKDKAQTAMRSLTKGVDRIWENPDSYLGKEVVLEMRADKKTGEVRCVAWHRELPDGAAYRPYSKWFTKGE